MCVYLGIGSLPATLRFQRRVKPGGASSLLESGDFRGVSLSKRKSTES